MIWMGILCVILYRCPPRVWLQYSGCPDHHSGLNVRYLPDLLQLLPGDLRPHLAAVCGSCSGDPLRRCTPAPHTTGMRCCNFLMMLQYVSNWGVFFIFEGFRPPWSPSWPQWWTPDRRKSVSVEGPGNDRRNLCLFPHGKAVFITSTLP